MSSNSFLVDLRKSMIIANPQHFPMNMEKTAKEDSPVETYPIVAYDAKNVVPTPFGYKSFFEESTRLNIGNLTGKFVQKIFNYQTVNMDSVQFALCEDGIYVAFATEPTPANWARIVDLSATMATGIRRLWTVAVISNVVYLYQAGQSKFWAIVDPAKYAEAASPSLIAGATRSQVWTNWATGLISYIPSFLNMAGQIGLFRADNRLGFWDSDNSVGWSSSVAIEDFKPDAKTFAGSTKFADVQGRIVKILGSGDSFVIYATRSIVNCIGLDNSPEKWRGEAIMSEVGVAFDNQIAAAQPDQIHYCITQAGLCAITAGSPEYIATEVMDYIAETFPLYSLTVIEGRYLFISVNGSFPGSEYGTESVELLDYNNNKYIFPRPTYPQLEDLGDYLEEALAGRNGETQGSFKDYEPIVDTGTIPPAQPLEPCYDIKIFKSTFSDTTFAPYPEGNEYFYSKLTPAVSYYQTPIFVNATVTNNFIEEDTIDPGDFHGDEVIEKLNEAMIAYNRQIDYQNALMTANDEDTEIALTNDWDIPPEDYVGVPMETPWERTQIGEAVLFNALSSEDIKVSSNECRTRLFTSQLRKLTTKIFFEGVEKYAKKQKAFQYLGFNALYEPTYAESSTHYYCPILDFNGPGNSCQVPISGREFVAWDSMNVVTPNIPNVVLILPAELSFYAEFFDYINQITDGAGGGDVNSAQYAQWALHFYPEQCDIIGADMDSWKARLDSALSAQLGVYTDQGYDPDSVGNKIMMDPIVGWITGLGWLISENPGIPWLAAGTYPGLGTIPAWTYVQTTLKYTYTNGAPASPVYYALGNQVVWYPAVRTSYEDMQALNQLYGTRGYKLIGTISREVTLEPDTAEENTIYDLEQSGWGYVPGGGFSFRKTHSRHSSTSCPYPGAAISIAPPDNMTTVKLPPLDRPELNNPGYVWDYPDAIPLPPNYALFQKGSLGAYYPTYGAAAVYDLLLQKWGMYNNSHKLIQELMPVNRVDSSIMPVLDKGMFAGALNPASECTVFKDLNPQSRITYGKMAFYRRGMSLATGAIAHFGALATGTLVVEASMDGVTVDPLLSYAVPFVNQRNVTLPFTTRAKWFNIRVEGNFNLTYLELLAESRGRR